MSVGGEVQSQSQSTVVVGGGFGCGGWLVAWWKGDGCRRRRSRGRRRVFLCVDGAAAVATESGLNSLEP